MATIDTTDLTFSFLMNDPNVVNHAAQSAVTPLNYSWTTTATNLVSALGTGITGSATAPTAGIISAITITNGGGGLFIGDLDLSLTSIVNVSNATTHQDLFWNGVLAGTTDILVGGSGDVTLAGDYAIVRAGQTRSGVRDYFTQDGDSTSGSFVMGDAVEVLAGGTLTGGADVFTGLRTLSMIGDARAVTGTLNGGADSFTTTGRVISFTPIDTLLLVAGDAVTVGNTGILNGGDDTISLTDITVNTVLGDADQVAGGFTGGDDTITLSRTLPVLSPTVASLLAGDALVVSNGAGAAMPAVTGGDDRITLTDMGAGVLVGDFGQVIDRSMVGGDDVITVTSVVPAASFPPLPVSPLPISILAGDALAVVASLPTSLTVTGGDDTITLTQTLLTSTTVFGDMQQMVLQNGSFQGGDDTISLTFTRTDSTSLPSATFFGDTLAAAITGSGALTFGDDRITVDLRNPTPGGGMFQLYGDNQSASITGPGGVVRFGDDVLTIMTSNATVTSVMFGDGEAGVLADGRIDWGNDRLTGGQTGDTLIGDGFSGPTIEGQIGGDDFLDGQGGNDTLIGGFGNDTAIFSSLDRAVTVFLEGVPGFGSGVHAIGQGRDRLDQIESIIGSRRADMIVGDDNANTIEGGAGNDALDGDGGLGDVVSYASSTAGVTVRLWNQTATGGHATGDRIANFEGAIGSAFNDALIGSDGVANTLRGGAGADYMDGLTGEDWADYTGSNAGVTARLWNDTGTGGHAQGDTLANIEHLTGSAFNDVLIGQDGQNNSLEGMAGADYLDGLGGIDTATYARSDASVTVRLFNGTGEGGHAQGDTLANIENLIGSLWSDSLIGSDAIANSIEGGSGNDFLAGLSGNDQLYGGADSFGNDTLRGGAGADSLYGGNGLDTADYVDSSVGVIVRLWNGTGQNGDAQGDILDSIEILHGSALGDNLQGRAGQDDTLRGNAGADYLDGISGTDTADYSNSAAGVTIRLWNGTGQGGDAQGDTLANIDRVIGSAQGDNLQGKDGSGEVLLGGGGSDYLNGLTGSDTLDGGAGNDTLDGGGNGDLFVFARGYGQDVVTLFENGSDLVDLVGLSFGDLTLTSIAGGVRAAITGEATTWIDLMGVVIGDISSADFI